LPAIFRDVNTGVATVIGCWLFAFGLLHFRTSPLSLLGYFFVLIFLRDKA
jgi:hypothetical protein